MLAFGIAKDIFGWQTIQLQLDDAANAGNVKAILEQQYPQLKELASYMIAVNDEYANADTIIHPGDEVAIIPPVSGG